MRALPTAVSRMLLLATAVVLASCGRPPVRADAGPPGDPQRIKGPAFGTYYRVTWIGETPKADVVEQVRREIDRGNRLFNTWSDDSVVSRFNAHDSTEPFEVPDAFVEVLDLCLLLARQSDGAYDPTVAPLLDLLGFGPSGRPDDPPSEDAVSDARSLIDYRGVTVLEDRNRSDGVRRIAKSRPRIQIELSSVSKGWVVDRLSGALTRIGVDDHLVDIGGELVARGRRSAERAWTVAVEKPPSTTSNRPGPISDRQQSIVSLEDGAIATSGSYRNFLESGHHILDPRTGANPLHRIASVSVLAPTCALADGLATTLMVTGYQDGLDVLDHHPGVCALFLDVTEDREVRELRVDWPESDSGGSSGK